MEGILKQLISDLEKIELTNKIAIEFIKTLAMEGNGYWAKSAEQVLIAINNRGNSPTQPIVEE